jgi:hypothetical protein
MRAINEIWGSGPEDIYAVGGTGTLMHSTGNGMWELQDAGTASNLSDVWGSGPGDVYISVVSNVILHSTGDGEWEHQVQTAGITFNGIWGSGPDDVYALTGGVYHRTGGSWEGPQTVTGGPPLRAIWGSGPNDIYIGTQAPAQSTIYHSTGNGLWAPQQNAPDIDSAIVIWGSDAQHVYAGIGSSVFFSDGGGTWRVQLTVEGGGVAGLWGSGQDSVYACTSNGLFYRSNGAGQWSEGQRFHDAALSVSCSGIWGTDADNIYLGTSYGIYHGTPQ